MQNKPKEYWISAVYERTSLVYETKEKALENAWQNDESNVTHVIEYSAYDALIKKLSTEKTEITKELESEVQVNKMTIQSLTARFTEIISDIEDCKVDASLGGYDLLEADLNTILRKMKGSWDGSNL
jgi:hypothetical protein